MRRWSVSVAAESSRRQSWFRHSAGGGRVTPLSRHRPGCSPRNPKGCPPSTLVLALRGRAGPGLISLAAGCGQFVPRTVQQARGPGWQFFPDRPSPSAQVAVLPPPLHPGPGPLPPRLPGSGQALQVPPGLVSSLPLGLGEEPAKRGDDGAAIQRDGGLGGRGTWAAGAA